jgi:N-formylglutamate deformylase
VVASIPHGSSEIPERFGRSMLRTERLWVDAYTPELFGCLSELGASVIEASYSRFVADPNRDWGAPAFGPFWSGIVASTDSDGEPIYAEEPSAAELDARIATSYRPYHDALDAALGMHLTIADQVVLLDLHSFGAPIDADIVLGNGSGLTCRPEVMDALDAALIDQGFSTGRNERFPGGWIVRRFIADPRVDALQLELNQRCYADPGAVDRRDLPLPYDANRIKATRERLRRAFRAALLSLEGHAP